MASRIEEVRGFMCPVATPFSEDGREVDEKCLREIIDFYVSVKVHALFILGSFGNGPALRAKERKRVAEVALSHLKGRLPAVIHVGTVDPQTASDLGKHARDHGADAIAVVGPYYYNDHTEWEICEHYRQIDAAVGLPMLVYNNARYSGYDITPQLMVKLREAAPRIFGMKLSEGSVDRAKRYFDVLKEPFSIFASSDNFVTAMLRGIKLAGMINPPLAWWPELGVEVVEAYLRGDMAGVLEAQKRAYAFFDVTRPFRAHGRGTSCEVLRAHGMPIQRYPRWSTLPFTDEEKKKLYQGLERVGFPIVKQPAKAVAV